MAPGSVENARASQVRYEDRGLSCTCPLNNLNRDLGEHDHANVMSCSCSLIYFLCQLFIPSIQIFGLTDTIPFHLQLCSSLQSLQELLPPTSTLLKPPNGIDQSKVGSHNDRWEEGGQTIRLSITRQVVVEIAGRRRFRTFCIGVGNMWPVPPIAHHYSDNSRDGVSSTADSKEDGVCLDWQGEVKAWPEVSTGGFSASNLLVKVWFFVYLA